MIKKNIKIILHLKKNYPIKKKKDLILNSNKRRANLKFVKIKLIYIKIMKIMKKIIKKKL